ncbi:MAG TPA: beta-propeller fold lactonase family protein, partial [Bryobacteraceae bacterium]
TGLALSHDGRFAYTAAGQARALGIFKRDLESGQLTLVDSVKGPEVQLPSRVRVSSDDKYVTFADSRAKTATIFKRDAESGALTKLASASEELNGVTDAKLSLDDHFLYTASLAGLSVFKFDDGKLSLIQSERAEDGLQGLRPLVISPDGHWLYTVAETSGTLGVFRRDAGTGKIEVLQTLSNGQDGVTTLAGAFRIALSNDGKNIYVSAGRNQGDRAITGFEVQPDGRLKLLQNFVNGVDDFDQFEGGNEITVSPDDKWVFVAASVSDRFFRFRRDPTTGKLTYVTSQQAGTFRTGGAAGIRFSPDGKFVYIADQAEGAIEVYKMP